MKSAVLLTAMLSGLCAEAMAVPIRSDIRTAFDQNASPGAVTVNSDAVTMNDFQHEAAYVDFPPEDWELNPPALVTTWLDYGDTLDELDEQLADETTASRSLQTPEPPPFVSILIGLVCLLIFAVFRQSKLRHSKPGRRVRRRAMAAQ